MNVLMRWLVVFTVALGTELGAQSINELLSAAQDGNKAALRRLHASANKGVTEAQLALSQLYWIGIGVPKDVLQAVAWERMAADKGDPAAQCGLGNDYSGGYGVPKDVVKAIAWWRKSAEQGWPAAQFMLGQAYYVGEGVPQDAVQAMAWWKKSAAQSYAAAQTDLDWVNAHATTADAVPRLPSLLRGADPYRTVSRKMSDGTIMSFERPEIPDSRNTQAQNDSGTMNSQRFVPMLQDGGVYAVPVLINNTITLKFVVDSGASDVSIPADVVTTLMRTGTITESDFIGSRTYVQADGSRTSSRTFRIRSLKVGDIVLENVVGSVAEREGALLLGQSFLGRFKSWSIDNTKHALVLE